MKILRLFSLSLVTMVMIPMGVNAHCTDDDPPHPAGHRHCDPEPPGGGGGGKGEDGDVFTMLISGDIGGESKDGFPWSRSGGKDSIGGPPGDHDSGVSNSGTLTDVATFFAALIGGPFTVDQANECFGDNNPDIRGGGLGTGKKDVAQAQFWFDAETFVENSDRVVTYQLRYLGTFKGAEWLPAPAGQISELIMKEWRLTATNEGQDIKAISCIGEGPAAVRIDVTNVTP